MPTDAVTFATGHAPVVTDPEDRDRFRRLPEPVPPEDTVETVDTTARPLADPSEERDRMLREVGGA